MGGRNAKAVLIFGVYDHLVKRVICKTQKVVFASSFNEIDVHELPKGVYVVEILSDGVGITNQKFSKM